jgi:YVTN family beta-propeller protein
MADSTKVKSSPSRSMSPTLVAAVVVGIALVAAGVMLYGIATTQLSSPNPSVAGLRRVKDIPLPSVAIAPPGHAPIQALPIASQEFDFQALDPRTGLIFMSHSGPSAAKQALDLKQLPAGTRFRSQLLIFDTKKQTVIGQLDIPDVHGVAVAPDLGRAYAADANDDRVYVIDEASLHIVATIALGLQPCASLPCESPDAMEYDAVDHRLFVSDNGGDPAHQDIGVIDVLTNQFVAAITLGLDQWGDDIGHLQYDPILHRLFVAVQPHPQPAPPAPTPASGSATPPPAPVVLPSAQFDTIDPVSLQVLNHLTLTDTHACSDPHGLVIDAAQNVAFTACEASHTLMMINLQTMKLYGPWPTVLKPDILRLDLSLHRLYMPGGTGVSIFDEHAASTGTIKKLGDFVVVKGSTSHTMSVDPNTHVLYFPIQDEQNRPVLRIMQYASA